MSDSQRLTRYTPTLGQRGKGEGRDDGDPTSTAAGGTGVEVLEAVGLEPEERFLRRSPYERLQ